MYFKYIITILLVDGIWAESCHDASTMNENSTLANKITRLDISYNNLVQLNRRTFKDYTNLEQLYIINSEVVFIDDGTFEDLHQLKVLNIAKNFISRLTSKPFGPRNQLEILVISGNGLLDLDEFDINHFPNLKYFDISNNLLTRLPESLMKKVKEDENFTLVTRCNAWNCTDKTWFKGMNLLTVCKFSFADIFFWVFITLFISVIVSGVIVLGMLLKNPSWFPAGFVFSCQLIYDRPR